MNGWMKFYSDGTHYSGEDSLVHTGKASWRKSSLRNIIRVFVAHNGFTLIINGPGEYWQSDTCRSIYPGGTQLLTRRIQRQIESTDKFFQVNQNYGKLEVSFNCQELVGKLCPIAPEQIGQWLTLEYNVATGDAKYSILKEQY